MRSVKINLAANYLGQVYLSVAGFVALPIYVREMGAAAFGLVAFFSMLQLWFQLLDLGLSQTVTLQAGRFRGGLIDAKRWEGNFRAAELVSFALAGLGAAGLAALSARVASDWLQLETISTDDAVRALVLIAAILWVRNATGAHRSALVGYEEQVWLNVVSVGFGTARILGVIVCMRLWGGTAVVFLAWQLAVSLAEAWLIVRKARRLLPRGARSGRWAQDLRLFWREREFIVGAAISSSLWLMVSNADRLVLSRLLPLSAFAHYGFAVTAASSLMLVGLPSGAVLQPRLTRLVAGGDEAELLRLYLRFTRLLCILIFPAACWLSLFSRDLLWVWTGDRALADDAAASLSLLAAGNAVYVIGALAYYLQNAFGDLRLHLRSSVAVFLIAVPALLIFASSHGAKGASAVWLALNLVYIVVVLPLVHRRLIPALRLRVWLREVAVVLASVAAVGGLLWRFTEAADSRVAEAARLAMSGCLLLLVAILASGEGIEWLRRIRKVRR